MYDVYREVCFSQKGIYKWVELGFATMCLSEKRVHRVEICWFSDKEKGPCAVISKEDHVDSLQGYERSHHY